jgi:hypothetical protein
MDMNMNVNMNMNTTMNTNTNMNMNEYISELGMPFFKVFALSRSWEELFALFFEP